MSKLFLTFVVMQYSDETLRMVIVAQYNRIYHLSMVIGDIEIISIPRKDDEYDRIRFQLVGETQYKPTTLTKYDHYIILSNGESYTAKLFIDEELKTIRNKRLKPILGL